jgi:cation:H+ antiporter
MLTEILLVAAGLVALFFGGNWLVKGAARLASALGISPVLIGLTVVAFGTSVPELLVGIDSALKGVSDIALGNVVGSNIANVGLILGVTAFMHPVMIHWSLLKREIPIMVGVSIIALLMALDGNIGQVDGILLVVGFVLFNIFAYTMAQREKNAIQADVAEFVEHEGITPAAKINRLLEVVRLLGGIALLVLGAQWTVDGSVAVARGLGVSEFIIGVTLVAVGTSLPELTAAVVGAMQKETDIVVGNVIGSNIANILAILGATAVVSPIGVTERVIGLDMLVMIGFALALLPFLLRNVMGRWQGIVFIAAYAIFIGVTVLI